ncbi:hypothetical protein ZWY2020_013668 [Hordeum vulgare]|nr:hypothetical protein ZWY2020_013668 [Hordeum vulgare]
MCGGGGSRQCRRRGSQCSCRPNGGRERHPAGSSEEEVSSLPEVQEQPSNTPMLPATATPKVLKESDRTQMEAKEVQPSDMPPVTLDDTNVNTEIDDIAEVNIVEDLDNPPSEKEFFSDSSVLEPKPMLPTM